MRTFTLQTLLLTAAALAALRTDIIETAEAGATEAPQTTLPLPTFVTSIPLDELLGNGTVHDGEEEVWDFGGSEIPIVQSTRTRPLTPPDLKNVTMIATGYEEAFTLYKTVYSRDYKTDLEDQKRYRYFLRNMASAYYNQTVNPLALFGANNFSDYSPTEFLPYHNLSTTYTEWANRSADRGNRPPAATGEDGLDILQNPFGQDYALYDTQGEYTVLGRGNAFWNAPTTPSPTGAGRAMAGADVAAEKNVRRRTASKSLSGVATDTASAAKSIISGVKSLKELLTGQGPTAEDDERWESIEEAYENAKETLAGWGDALWHGRKEKERLKKEADEQAKRVAKDATEAKEGIKKRLKLKKNEDRESALLSAAAKFGQLESEYVSLKQKRTQSKGIAIHPSLDDDGVEKPAKRAMAAMAGMPQTFDWRVYGVVSPIRDQGACGGCWAFAVAGNIEGVWRIAGRGFTDLSEQSLISCDTYSGNMGCSGGVMQYAYNYIIKYQKGYLANREAYPFSSGPSGQSGFCVGNQQVPGAAINRYVSIAKDENLIMQYVANLGPVAVAIDSLSWQSYTGGILTNCIGIRVDHAVLIIGYDNAYDPPYWIIKNTWGNTWGEEGYIRIAKGTDQCLITRNPTTALAFATATLPAMIPIDISTTVYPTAGTTTAEPTTTTSKPATTPAKPTTTTSKPATTPAKPTTTISKPATTPAKPTTTTAKPVATTTNANIEPGATSAPELTSVPVLQGGGGGASTRPRSDADVTSPLTKATVISMCAVIVNVIVSLVA